MNKIRIIYIIIRALKALVFFIGLFSSIVFVFLPTGKDSFTNSKDYKGITTWVVEDPDLVAGINEAMSDEKYVHFNDIRLRFKLPIDSGYKLILILITLVTSAYFFYLLHLSENVIDDIRKGNSFSMENIKRIKIIGLLFALFLIEGKVISAISNWWIGGVYEFEGLKIINEAPLMWHDAIIGAIIFVIGFAFEQGLKMKEEQELTV